MSNEKLNSAADKYNAKVPALLNSQFPDHVSKSEAVNNRFVERREREATKLFPAGNYH